MSDQKDDNTIVIDLSNDYGAGSNYISAGAGIDTLMIDPIDTITLTGSSSVSSITLPSYTTSYSTGIGAVGSSASYYVNSGTNWNQATVNIDNNGIDVKDGDIKIKGRSLGEFMSKMEQRMAILVPDPEKLEKFEALKKAYEHYKTMEALCFPEKEEDKDK